MVKNKYNVDLRTLKECYAYISQVNSVPLKSIVWYKDGYMLTPNELSLDDYAFTGLSNARYPFDMSDPFI